MVSRILRPQTLEKLRPNRCIENSHLRKTETAEKLEAWNSCPTAIPQFGFVGDDLASRTFHYLNPPNQRENLIPVIAFYCDKNQYRNFIQNQYKYKINLSHFFFTIFFFHFVQDSEEFLLLRVFSNKNNFVTGISNFLDTT